MNNNLIDTNFYTTTELAQVLGISKISVLKRIWRGNIKAKKFGRNFLIFKKDVNIVKIKYSLQK